MLSPDLFMIFVLLMGLVSIRSLFVTVRKRRELFDDHFTAADRQQLSEAAFFLLLPLSVPLHEAGHAITVLAFGGQIDGFGWYFFYGFVEHSGFYTANQLFWIALSGNLVSIGLGLIALALAILRPVKPPINYMLFIFGVACLINALIFYPLLDFLGGVVGDWSQIYTRDTTTLSTITAVSHVLFVLAGFVIWRDERFRRLYAIRTGRSPESMRRISKTQAASELLAAGEALAASWRHPLRVVAEAQGPATGITLRWISNGYGRVVAAYAVIEGSRHIELHGGIQQLDGSGRTYQRPIARIDGIPTPNEVTPAIVEALDAVDAWDMRAVEQTI